MGLMFSFMRMLWLGLAVSCLFRILLQMVRSSSALRPTLVSALLLCVGLVVCLSVFSCILVSSQDDILDASASERSSSESVDPSGAASTASVADETEKGPQGHPGMHVVALFPDFADGQIPLGDIVDVAIGVINNARETQFNVSFAAARLTHPHDYGQVLLNFTRFPYGNILKSGSEASYAYKFRTDATLDPREMGVVVSLYYFDNERWYEHLAFNGTFQFIEPEVSWFDFSGILLLVMIGGMVGGVGFVVYYCIFFGRKTSSKRAAAKTSIETGTEEVKVDESFAHSGFDQYLSRQKPRRRLAKSEASASASSS